MNYSEIIFFTVMFGQYEGAPEELEKQETCLYAIVSHSLMN